MALAASGTALASAREDLEVVRAQLEDEQARLARFIIMSSSWADEAAPGVLGFVVALFVVLEVFRLFWHHVQGPNRPFPLEG